MEPGWVQMILRRVESKIVREGLAFEVRETQQSRAASYTETAQWAVGEPSFSRRLRQRSQLCCELIKARLEAGGTKTGMKRGFCTTSKFRLDSFETALMAKLARNLTLSQAFECLESFQKMSWAARADTITNRLDARLIQTVIG